MLFPAILTIAALAATAEAPLEPSRKWVLEEEQSRCILQRTFNAGPGPITVAIVPRADFTSPRLLIEQKSGKVSLKSGNINGVVTLYPSTKKYNGDARSTKLSSGSNLTLISLDTDFLTDVSSSESLGVVQQTGSALHLSLNGIKSGAAALAKCENELLESWGVDPARIRREIPVPRDAIFNEDYPDSAIFAGASGITETLLTIDENGKIADCRVTNSSGSADLDSTACKLYKHRLHYSPMLDKSGTPVKSWMIAAISWVI